MQVTVAKIVIMVTNYPTSFVPCHFPTGKLAGSSHNQSEAFVNAFPLLSHGNTGIKSNNSIILDEPLCIENTSCDNKKPSFDSWKIKAITDYYTYCRTTAMHTVWNVHFSCDSCSRYLIAKWWQNKDDVFVLIFNLITEGVLPLLLTLYLYLGLGSLQYSSVFMQLTDVTN